MPSKIHYTQKKKEVISNKKWKYVDNRYSNISNINMKNSGVMGAPLKIFKPKNIEEIKMKAKAKQSEAHYFHLQRMGKAKGH